MPERLAANALEIKLIVLGLLAWAARLAFKSDLTAGLIVRQLIISVLVGVLASEFVAESAADWKTNAIFCACIFLADDILAMVLAFGDYAKGNQQTIFKRITAFLAGK
jgi:hypothetical protein